ncbi:Calx-beta domain-containing protein [Mycobacterium sp. ENV421]|uniref:Ig-like domain-containing protein n=1 Tax=Mycobacterium sp. ENV421 TaxID=1213407 RepID=UPI0013049102|nr:Calx-beta domain-containing protein [Mycobacterium sp. ENV421]
MSGATTTGPAPTNPLQRALYSLAKSVSNTFDPAPGPGTPTVGTPDPVTGAVAGSLGFATGNGLTFTATDPSQGTVTVTDDGTYTYSPTEAARQAATGSTTDAFVATVHSGLSTRSVTVVVPLDPGTPVAGTALVNSPDPTTGVVTGSAKFTDTAGRSVTYSVVTTSTGGGAVSIDAATGVFTYTPTHAQRLSDATADTIAVTASNGVRTATKTVTVTILGTSINEAPVAGNDDFTAVEGTAITGDVLTNDSDPDGDPLSAALATGPSHGSVSVNPNGSFVYAPTTNYVGPDSFTYTATDGVASTPATVNITVKENNTGGVTANLVGYVPPVDEGNSGTTTVPLTVQLSGASTQTITVNYTVGSVLDSATAGEDFQSTTGTLTFTPGQTQATIPVTIYGDTTYENDETLYVFLNTATNAIIGTTNFTSVTIKNDDTGGVTANLVGYVPPVDEGNSGTTTVPLTVQLSGASTQTITVNYTVGSVLDSATAGEDFQSTTGTLTFTPGQTQATIPVTIYGDTTYENDETLYVFLNTATNAIIGTTNFTSVTIKNDDTGGPAAVSVAAAALSNSAVERSTGTRTEGMASADAADLPLDLVFNGFNSSIGWVPFVGTVINAVKMAVDTLELVTAALSLDAGRVGNEIGQIVADTIGLIPIVGAPVASLIYDLALGGDAQLGALVRQSLQSYFDTDSNYSKYGFHFDSVDVTPTLLGNYSAVAKVSTPTHESVSVAVDITNSGFQTGWSIPLEGRLALLALEWNL